MFKTVVYSLVIWVYLTAASVAQILTADLEIKRIPNIGAVWQTVALENTYTDPVVVCSYNLPSDTDNSAVTRIRNAGATSFELRIQGFENSSAVTASDVHCVIADVGAYVVGSLKFEARKTRVTGVSGNSVPGTWNNTNTVDVSGDVTQTYTAPRVIGQVMSFDDVRASVFWANDCDNRGNPAFTSGMADGICVGRHIGQINATRNAETIGYIVLEQATGTVNDIGFAIARGPVSIAGVGNNPPYNYTVSGDFDTAVVTSAAENGGQGGWAVLYGTDPLPNGTLQLAIDEETVAGDTGRGHTTEEVDYFIFDNNQSPSLTVAKSIAPENAATPYQLPNSDVLYTLSITNAGSGPVDTDSLFFVDSLPAEVSFFNGDIDAGGPATGPVLLESMGSGITLNAATDIAYSDAATAPTSLAACTYTPAAGYDPSVRHICFAPTGALREGTITPSTLSLTFRAKIR